MLWRHRPFHRANKLFLILTFLRQCLVWRYQFLPRYHSWQIYPDLQGLFPRSWKHYHYNIIIMSHNLLLWALWHVIYYSQDINNASDPPLTHRSYNCILFVLIWRTSQTDNDITLNWLYGRMVLKKWQPSNVKHKFRKVRFRLVDCIKLATFNSYNLADINFLLPVYCDGSTLWPQQPKSALSTWKCWIINSKFCLLGKGSFIIINSRLLDATTPSLQFLQNKNHLETL